MNAFEIILMPEAQADIGGLGAAILTRVLDRLEWLGENAGLVRHEPLRWARVARQLPIPGR